MSETGFLGCLLRLSRRSGSSVCSETDPNAVPRGEGEGLEIVRIVRAAVDGWVELQSAFASLSPQSGESSSG